MCVETVRKKNKNFNLRYAEVMWYSIAGIYGETEIKIQEGNRVKAGTTVNIICSIDPRVSIC